MKFLGPLERRPVITADDQLPYACLSGSTARRAARSATDGVEGCPVAVESSLRHVSRLVLLQKAER